MCDFCAEAAEAGAPIDAARLWRLARQIEATMPGTPALERDWSIFTGLATGSIAFRALERLADSRRTAMASLATEAATLPRFRCEAVQ